MKAAQRASSPTSNSSEYVAGGASPGTTVRTAYTRLRLDPTTLTVDTGDQRFATSTGELTHDPDTVKAMPHAVAMGARRPRPPPHRMGPSVRVSPLVPRPGRLLEFHFAGEQAACGDPRGRGTTHERIEARRSLD